MRSILPQSGLHLRDTIRGWTLFYLPLFVFCFLFSQCKPNTPSKSSYSSGQKKIYSKNAATIPLINGPTLTTQGITVEPYEYLNRSFNALKIRIEADPDSDYEELIVCNDAQPAVCKPEASHPERFSERTVLSQPPPGLLTIQVRGCVFEKNALDPTKLCGPWKSTVYRNEVCMDKKCPDLPLDPQSVMQGLCAEIEKAMVEYRAVSQEELSKETVSKAQQNVSEQLKVNIANFVDINHPANCPDLIDKYWYLRDKNTIGAAFIYTLGSLLVVGGAALVSTGAYKIYKGRARRLAELKLLEDRKNQLGAQSQEPKLLLPQDAPTREEVTKPDMKNRYDTTGFEQKIKDQDAAILAEDRKLEDLRKQLTEKLRETIPTPTSPKGLPKPPTLTDPEARVPNLPDFQELSDARGKLSKAAKQQKHARDILAEAERNLQAAIDRKPGVPPTTTPSALDALNAKLAEARKKRALPTLGPRPTAADASPAKPLTLPEFKPEPIPTSPELDKLRLQVAAAQGEFDQLPRPSTPAFSRDFAIEMSKFPDVLLRAVGPLEEEAKTVLTEIRTLLTEFQRNLARVDALGNPVDLPPLTKEERIALRNKLTIDLNTKLTKLDQVIKGVEDAAVTAENTKQAHDLLHHTRTTSPNREEIRVALRARADKLKPTVVSGYIDLLTAGSKFEYLPYVGSPELGEERSSYGKFLSGVDTRFKGTIRITFRDTTEAIWFDVPITLEKILPVVYAQSQKEEAKPKKKGKTGITFGMAAGKIAAASTTSMLQTILASRIDWFNDQLKKSTAADNEAIRIEKEAKAKLAVLNERIKKLEEDLELEMKEWRERQELLKKQRADSLAMQESAQQQRGEINQEEGAAFLGIQQKAWDRRKALQDAAQNQEKKAVEAIEKQIAAEKGRLKQKQEERKKALAAHDEEVARLTAIKADAEAAFARENKNFDTLIAEKNRMLGKQLEKFVGQEALGRKEIDDAHTEQRKALDEFFIRKTAAISERARIVAATNKAELALMEARQTLERTIDEQKRKITGMKTQLEAARARLLDQQRENDAIAEAQRKYETALADAQTKYERESSEFKTRQKELEAEFEKTMRDWRANAENRQSLSRAITSDELALKAKHAAEGGKLTHAGMVIGGGVVMSIGAALISSQAITGHPGDEVGDAFEQMGQSLHLDGTTDTRIAPDPKTLNSFQKLNLKLDTIDAKIKALRESPGFADYHLDP